MKSRYDSNDRSCGQVGEILLVEHYPPVYTFGLRQKDYATHAEHLRSFGAEVHKVCYVDITPEMPRRHLFCGR